MQQKSDGKKKITGWRTNYRFSIERRTIVRLKWTSNNTRLFPNLRQN